MSRSHKIWVEATGGTAKSFGCGKDDIRMDIYVGTSASTSKHLSNVRLNFFEHSNGTLHFTMEIDGQTYRTEALDRKTKQYDGIEGYPINGKPKDESEKAAEANSFLNTVGMVAAFGELLAGPTTKDKNDWKQRMITAGVPEGTISFPEDWDSLGEDEKELRLNGVIEAFRM